MLLSVPNLNPCGVVASLFPFRRQFSGLKIMSRTNSRKWKWAEKRLFTSTSSREGQNSTFSTMAFTRILGYLCLHYMLPVLMCWDVTHMFLNALWSSVPPADQLREQQKTRKEKESSIEWLIQNLTQTWEWIWASFHCLLSLLSFQCLCDPIGCSHGPLSTERTSHKAVALAAMFAMKTKEGI